MEFQQDGRFQDEMAFPRTRSSPPEDVEFQQDGQREDEFPPIQDGQQEDVRTQDEDAVPPRTVCTFTEMKSSSP